MTEETYKQILSEMLNFEEVADYESLKGDARRKYERDLKRYRDNLSCINGAREQGREEGRQEGRQEGFKNAVYKIALSLKKNNAPIELIVSSTGLTPEQIASLN
jgi:predicted transposase/invertase (TIGR01784 family)